MISSTPRLLSLLVAAIAGLGMAGCRQEAKPAAGKSAAPAGPAAKVSLVPVQKRAVERYVEITGTLLGDEEATISSKVAGRVLAIEHDLGDVVAPGAVLARVDPRDFELALAEKRATASAALAKLGLTAIPSDTFNAEQVPTVQRALAEASNARAKLERATQLFEQKPPLLSAQDYADIRTASDVARSQADVELMTARATLAEARAQSAGVDVAEQRLRDAMVTAPGSAAATDSPPRSVPRRYRIAERLVSQGEYVTEGRQLFRLVSSDIVKLRARAPERFSGAIQPGQKATVATESTPAPLAGTVTRVSPAVDPASRAFAVEIEVVNSDELLKPGAFAQGRIVVGVDEGVTLVPSAAVVSFAGVERVFSVKNAKAVEHRVKLGQKVGDLVEVVGGLAAASIIGANAAGLAAGSPVDVVEPPRAATP